MAQYEISNFVDPKVLTDVKSLGEGIQGTTKDLMAFLEAQKALKKQLDDTSASNNETTKKMSEYSALVNKAAESHNKLVQTAKALDNQQKQLAQTEAKLATAHTATNQKLVEQKIKLQETNKAIRDKIKTADAEEGSLVRMRQKLAQLTAEYDKSGTRTKAAAKEIGKLSKEIEIAENETNRFQRGVGGYANQLKGMTGGLLNGSVSLKQFGAAAANAGKAMLKMLLSPVGLIIAAVAGLGMVIGKAVKQAREYQAANAELAGVLGITRAETMSLQKESQRLGATTAFTAAEVTGLQIEYARLGFAQEEIKAVTKSTIDLSIAAKAGAAETAAFVGSTIRGFGLTAEEAGRVADTASKAFSSSALDFAKLSTGLGIVAPAARAFGDSMESSTAKLGKLADAGIDASTAGTSLRNIYLELAKKGITYDEAMQKIATSQDKLTTANDLFGKRGAVAAIVLSNEAESVKELTTALEGAGGTAERVADEQLNTLDGSFKLLESAWSGLLFSFEDGEGIFIKIFKGLVDYVTWFLTGLTKFFNGISTGFAFVSYVLKDVYKFLTPLIDSFKSFGVTLKENVLNIIDPIIKGFEKFLGLLKNLGIVKEGKGYISKFIDERKEKQEAQAAADAVKAIVDTNIDHIEEKEKDHEKESTKRHKAALERAKQQMEAEKASRKVFEDLAKQERALDESLMDEKFEDFEDEKEMEAMLGEMIKKNIIDNNIAYTRQRMLIDATSKTEQERAERIFNLDKEVLNSAITANEQLLNSSTLSADRRVEIEGQIAQQRVDLEQMVFDKEMENNEKRKEAQEQLKESILATTNAIFDFRAERIGQDLELLEQANARGELSDTEYAKKKAELEIKAAKNKKIAGLFDVGIDTAKSVAKIWADVPKGDFGIMTAILTGLAIANGAMQAATIASAPLPAMPAFAKGTDNAPRRGLFGESGAELMLTQSGAVYYADKPTYFDGNEFKGAKIWSGAETAEIMNRTKTPQFGSSSRTDNLLLMEIKGMRKDMKRQKSPIFGEGNKPIGFEQNGSTTKIINFYKYGR